MVGEDEKEKGKISVHYKTPWSDRKQKSGTTTQDYTVQRGKSGNVQQSKSHFLVPVV